ncbi:hypothetical protein D9M72_438300 [compost metagenome]
MAHGPRLGAHIAVGDSRLPRLGGEVAHLRRQRFGTGAKQPGPDPQATGLLLRRQHPHEGRIGRNHLRLVQVEALDDLLDRHEHVEAWRSRPDRAKLHADMVGNMHRRRGKDGNAARGIVNADDRLEAHHVGDCRKPGGIVEGRDTPLARRAAGCHYTVLSEKKRPGIVSIQVLLDQAATQPRIGDDPVEILHQRPLRQHRKGMKRRTASHQLANALAVIGRCPDSVPQGGLQLAALKGQ